MALLDVAAQENPLCFAVSMDWNAMIAVSYTHLERKPIWLQQDCRSRILKFAIFWLQVLRPMCSTSNIPPGRVGFCSISWALPQKKTVSRGLFLWLFSQP